MATKKTTEQKIEGNAKKIADAAKTAGESVSKAAKVAGDNVSKAAKIAGENLSKAAKTAANSKAAKVTKEAAKTAAEKAKEGIMAFGNTVANKSKEIMELAKLNTQKSQKQKELEEAYKQLGEAVYSKGHLRGELAEKSKEIKQIYAELQQIEVAINCAQSVKTCKACGNKCNVNDNYCPNCGQKF
ncbi:MAG: hypothetical protein VB082_06450 [Christensenella sp.]|nr:hypothetical protein [Christensenella sp.]